MQSARQYKKLSYRRDSASWRSLCCSKSFNVTNFDTNRKPIYNFLLVNKSNINPISHFFQLQCSTCQSIAFDKRVPLINTMVLGNLFEYHHQSYISKN